MIIPQHIRGKAYYVVGLGKTGLSAIHSLQKAGAEVVAWDDNPHSREAAPQNVDLCPPDSFKWQGCSGLVLSPGIPHLGPQSHASAILAQKHKVPLLCDLEFLLSSYPDACFMGITGSNGKSTTTALITHILKTAGYRVQAGGNIGTPALDLEPPQPGSICVLELSSFQLERLTTRALSLSIFLNLTPNHLDRHQDMEGYLQAKKKIFTLTKPSENVTPNKVLGIDTPATHALYQQDPEAYLPISVHQTLQKGVYVQDHVLISTLKGALHTVMDLRGALSLKGDHNYENCAAAYAALSSLLPDFKDEDFIKGILTYPGLPHRQENLGCKNGISFINDSKATTLQAAVRSLAQHSCIYWIAGGKSKEGNLDLNLMAPYLPRIKKVYLMGESEGLYYDLLSPHLPAAKCGTLAKAFSLAIQEAQSEKQAVILLAPACASYDQFKNFEERGEAFRQLVATWGEEK